MHMLHFNLNNVFEKKKGNMLLFHCYNVCVSFPLIELLASHQAFNRTLYWAMVIYKTDSGLFMSSACSSLMWRS